MKRRWLDAMLVISLLAAPSLLTADGKTQAAYEQGKALFKAQCQVCHINKQEGDQPSAYTRQFNPVDFSDPDAWEDLDRREIRNVVKNGRGAMPAQRQLKPEEIEAIAEYLVKTYQPRKQAGH